MMTSTRIKIWIAALLSGLVLTIIVRGGPVLGTTVIKMDVAKLSQAAAFVVEGEVVETNCAWNREHTQIHTYVTFDLTDVYAGKATLGRMQIRLLGGAVGDTAMVIPGAPQFAVGERVVLFLHGTGQYIPIVGFHQGKLSFSVDPKTGREVVGNQDVGFFDKQELKSLVVKAREGR